MIEHVSTVKRGSVTIPAKLRKQIGLEEGDLVTFEVRSGRVHVLKVRVVPIRPEAPEAPA